MNNTLAVSTAHSVVGPRAPAPFHERPTSHWQAQPPAMAAYMHPTTAAASSEPVQPHYESVLDFTYHNPQQPQFVAENTIQNQYNNIQGSTQSARLDGDWKQSSFYSYRPNEVKHRKRTTRHQLKVLEETFRKTQKPDSNIRKTLALQLNMTPRNVQVWFQNRRAKDKTLAKRALKAAEEEHLREAQAGDSLDQMEVQSAADIHPEHMLHSVPREVGPTADSLVRPSAYSSSEEEFLSQRYEAPVRVENVVQQVTRPPPGFSRISSSSSVGSYAGQVKPSLYSAVANNDFMSRDILAPRGSLPSIRTATAYPDIHHQRSVSSPVFPCNVDSTSNVPLHHNANGNGVHSLYHQQQYSFHMSQQQQQQQQPDSQNLFHIPYAPIQHRVHRIPSGPLPAADFSFGGSPLSGPPSATSGELEDDEFSARFASYDRSSIARSDTTSSIGSYSQFSFDGDSNAINVARREDDSTPLVWHAGRRGSASHLVDNYVPVSHPGVVDGHPLYPGSQGISPHSAGYVTGSPRPCTALSVKAESVSSDNGLYNNWTAGYPDYQQTVQNGPHSQTPSPHDVRDAMAFQHGLYGYPGLGEQQQATHVYSPDNVQNGVIESSSSGQSSSLYLPLMNQGSQDHLTKLTSPTQVTAVDAVSDVAGSLDSQYATYQVSAHQSQGFGYETMTAPNFYLQACQ